MMLKSLSAASRRRGRATEKLVSFMPKSKMVAMSRKQKERASVSLIYLHLKPKCDTEVIAKPYMLGYAPPQFQKFDGRRRTIKEHVFLS